MAEPVSFPSTTSRFQLPLLFSGQSQKEFFINQSLSTVDTLLQHAVELSTDTAPTSALEGVAYRITSVAQGDWAGHDDQIAIQLSGSWQFIMPVDGMTVYDRDAGMLLHYNSGWRSAQEPIEASGGTIIDQEARQMLNELVEALRMLGIFPDPS